MSKLSRIIFISSLILLIPGMYNSFGDEKGKEKNFSGKVSIEPSRFYEKCMKLNPPQVLHYKFNSSKHVYFNIHYYGKDGRHYPVEKKRIALMEGVLGPETYGSFYNEKKPNFCMFWRNNSPTDVRVYFECEVDPE